MIHEELKHPNYRSKQIDCYFGYTLGEMARLADLNMEELSKIDLKRDTMLPVWNVWTLVAKLVQEMDALVGEREAEQRAAAKREELVGAFIRVIESVEATEYEERRRSDE